MSRSCKGYIAGPTSEILIRVPEGPITNATIKALEDAFHQEHENSYGYRSEEGERVEIVNVRLAAKGISDDDYVPNTLASVGNRIGNTDLTKKLNRMVYFGKELGWIETPVIVRSNLDKQILRGPVIIEEYDTTVVIPPTAGVFLDEVNNIRIDINI